MVVVDQAEEITEELWEILLARIRWAKVPSTAWQAVAAANDNGHNWMWRRFVRDPASAPVDSQCLRHPYCIFRNGHPDVNGAPRDIPCSTRRFFHGTTLDNRHNLSHSYVANLLSKPHEWTRHFVYATMEGGAGRLLPDPNVIGHFDPPVHWTKYRAIDHALNSPCCCLWIAVNTDGVAVNGVAPNAPYVYREYWAEHSSVDQHAQRIIMLSKGETIAATVIDKSVFRKDQSRPGGILVSIADLYMSEGLMCVPSTGDPYPRVERINQAHNRGMVLSDACQHLIKSMPEYYADQNKLDGTYKIHNRSSFHAVDALGYGLTYIPLDPRGDDIGDIKPEYLRRHGDDTLTKKHNELEYRRLKKIEDSAREHLMPIQKLDVNEFWGDGGSEPEVVESFDRRW